jgi:hypothetical protein
VDREALALSGLERRATTSFQPALYPSSKNKNFNKVWDEGGKKQKKWASATL